MAILSFSAGKSSINVLGDMLSTNRTRSQQLNKVSTSKRINKAADSVAESAVGSKLKNEVETLKSVLGNVFSTKSVLEVAENGLAQMSNVITRMTSLTMQSANQILTDDDREKIDAEFQELKNEIDRINFSTDFNGKKIFQGDPDKFYIGGGLRGVGILDVKYKDKQNIDPNAYFTVVVDSVSPNDSYVFYKYSMDGNRPLGREIIPRPAVGTKTEIDLSELGIIATIQNTGSTLSLRQQDLDLIYVDSDFVGGGYQIQIDATGNGGRLWIATSGWEFYFSESFDFLNKKPLYGGREIILTSEKDPSKKIIGKIVPGGKLEGITTDGNTPLPYQYNGVHNPDYPTLSAWYMLSPDRKIEFSAQVGSDVNNKIGFKMAPLDSRFLGLTNKHVNNIKDVNNLQEVAKTLKLANSQIQDARSKVAAMQNRLDFAVSDMQTTIINSESAVSAIFDLNVSDALVDLSNSELTQISESEALSRDIRTKQDLLKLF